MSFENKNFPTPESLPDENLLPLKIKDSKKHAEHGESTVWEVEAEDKKGQEKDIILKQVHKEEFASPEERRADREFYEFLKKSPIGKFVPDTLHFIAQLTPDSPPQEFRIQQFIDGKPIDGIPDEELYKNHEVVLQLLEFVYGATEILQESHRDKTFQPDFRRAFEATNARAILGGLLSNPRYTKNIIIANKPDEFGRQVFFVDTAVNAAERTIKREELLARHIVNPLEQFHFKKWRNKLENILKEPEKEKTKFLPQWQNPERLNFEGTDIDVYDIRPEGDQKEIPVVFLPGFGGYPLMFKRDIDALANHGRRVIAVDAPHGIDQKISEEVKTDLPDAELRKVAALMETLKIKNINKVDGVGNSEGSLVLVLAAAINPERFRNLILESPPGLVGQDTAMRLAGRFVKDMVKSEAEGKWNRIEKLKTEISLPQKDSSALSFKNIFQALQEMKALAKTQIPELLKEIKKKGIKILIIHGAEDNAFPMDRVQKGIKADMIDGFISVKGKHAQVRTRRENKAYVELAEFGLASLEKKQETDLGQK